MWKPCMLGLGHVFVSQTYLIRRSLIYVYCMGFLYWTVLTLLLPWKWYMEYNCYMWRYILPAVFYESPLNKFLRQARQQCGGKYYIHIADVISKAFASTNQIWCCWQSRKRPSLWLQLPHSWCSWLRTCAWSNYQLRTNIVGILWYIETHSGSCCWLFDAQV